MSAEIKSCKDAHKCGRYNRCSLHAPWSIPLPSSHTFRDEEINSDVVLAGLVGDGNERSDGRTEK